MHQKNLYGNGCFLLNQLQLFLEWMNKNATTYIPVMFIKRLKKQFIKQKSPKERLPIPFATVLPVIFYKQIMTFEQSRNSWVIAMLEPP